MSKRILFIEDEETLHHALGKVLSGAGYEMLSATNGEDGLTLAAKEVPDLILLDLILPKKNGFEVLKALKADPVLKKIPVIILTNLEGPGDVERVLEQGATTYLVKSNYGVHEILAKVKLALEHHS